MPPRAEWDPMRELATVQKRMNQLFETALARTDFETQPGLDSWRPVCDVYETAEAFVVCLELPGLEQSQIHVRLDGDDLVVEGERKMDRERPGEQFHRVERSYGRFSRRFRLPSSADREAVQAVYREGLLQVVLPHRERKQARPVRVSIG